ncbi:G2/mitotic-specific cyclin-B2-like isoform X2 [Hyla sarda]|uniref:G2/mitotic-specific cyclin-B2-like isoform X2 n=1 Tax=Hyla sarda TaxID=327740 RepID=UPI0024C2D1AB|nr:G2/mitotic-specific cyclin-B2-like isoform X2 [Hyla sarda]
MPLSHGSIWLWETDNTLVGGIMMKYKLCSQRPPLEDIRNGAMIPANRAAVVNCKMSKPVKTIKQEATERNVLEKVIWTAEATLQVPFKSDITMRDEDDLCHAFSEILNNIKDIDAEDADNPQMCSDYVKEVYAYLRQLEVKQSIRPNYLQGMEVNSRMRAILIDWLMQVHSKFKLLQETLYMAVAILDRFLQVHPVQKNKLQLVGVSSLFVASKYEEMYYPEIADFVYITDNTYSKAEIRHMERTILAKLRFDLGRPSPLHFLRRALRCCHTKEEQYLLAKYLMELTLMDYDMVHYQPSIIAAASLCLTQKVLNWGSWDDTIQHYTCYTEENLLPVMQHIAKNVVMVNNNMTKFAYVKNKFSSRKLNRISTISQLNSPILKRFAAPLISAI